MITRLRKRELEWVDNKDDDCEGEQDRVKEDKDGEKSEDYESEYENEEELWRRPWERWGKRG